MGFPGEELISTAISKFSEGIIHKMDEAEERRNREFSYKLKELEYYKGNYDKEIKSVFDKWFGILQDILIANNKNAPEETKKQYQKRIDSQMKIEQAMKLKIDTMKYGGTETGKVLALFSQISYKLNSLNDGSSEANKVNGIPQFSLVYVICLLLSTLKKEILGQEISPEAILLVLLTDYEETKDKISEAQIYTKKRLQELFPSNKIED